MTRGLSRGRKLRHAVAKVAATVLKPTATTRTTGRVLNVQAMKLTDLNENTRRQIREQLQRDNHVAGLRAVQPQPVERLPLVAAETGEETRWYGAATSFEITFTVYAVRPCDWDGYDIKALQDFCVTAGIIPGDGWKTLSGRVITRKAATQADEKTLITIT